MPVIAALGTVVFAGITVGQIALMVATTLYGISRASSAKSKAERQAREMAEAARAAMNLKFNTMSNVGNLPVVYGSVRVGGYYCLQEVSSDKKFLHIVIAHAEGECGAVSMLYLDDTPCTDKKFKMRKKVQVKLGTVTEMVYPVNAAPYSRTYDKYEEQEQDYDLVKWEYFSGTDAQPACASLVAALPDKWTAAHKLSGIAYSYVRLEWNPDVWRSVPVITVQMEGKKVFDPRTGTTGASSNPALALRDYLLSPRYGRGLRAADISDAGFIAAANYCDQLIDMGHKNIDANQVESVKPVPRYAINGVLDTSRPCLDNVQEILEHCRGTLLQADGVYRPVIDQADVPVMNFDADVMVGKLQIKMADRRDRLNQLNCRFVDPARNFVESSAAVINAAWRIEDGDILLESSRDYSLAYDERRAKFLAERALRDSRNNISISFTALSQAQLVQPTDVIAVSHETTGWQNKQFRVINVKPLPSGEVEITANEYDPGLYTDKPMTALPPAPATNLPDPFEILAAPASLTLVTDNQYGWAGEVQCRLKASWPAVQGLVVDYQVRWRKQSETTWQYMSTRELSATLPVVPGTPYFVSVAAVSAFGRVGLNVTAGATGVAPAGSLPDVTGIVCEFGPAGQFIFTWAKHPDAAKYALEIVTGGVTRRSDVIFTERYEYTLAMNRADAINRTVTIRVKAMANDGRGSANWATKSETNAPPVALAGLVAWSNSLAIAFNCAPPTEVDLAGVICHLGDTPVFTPSAATLAYKGRLDTPTLLTMRAGAPLVVGKTYYLKAAAYDVFGDDGIVYSPSLLVKISTISGDILDIESLGPEKLTPGLIGDIGKGVEALDVALPGLALDFNNKLNAKASAQSVTDLAVKVSTLPDVNIVDLSAWKVGSFAFPVTGALVESAMVMGIGADGLSQPLWQCLPSGDGSINGWAADGGWEAGELTIDPTKTYRFAVTVEQEVALGGLVYFGPKRHSVCSLNTVVSQGNPYFVSSARPAALSKWYLMVGYVFPAGSTGNTNAGAGLYDLETGLLLKSGNNFCWKADQTNSGHRAFLYECTDTTVRQYFCAPEVTLVTAPSTDIPKLNPLSATKTELAAQIQRIDNVIIDVNGKAGASALATLDAQVQNPTTGLVSKASQSQLDTVIADVAGKAAASSLTALDAIVKNPTTGLGTKASQSQLNNVIADVAGKAAASSLTALDAIVKNPTTGLGTKASQSQLNDVIADVAGKASAQSVTDLSAKVSTLPDVNLIDLSGWKMDSFAWPLNGLPSENAMVMGVGADGLSQVLWQCLPSGDGNNDGGWNANNALVIDPTKTYRFAVAVKREVINRGSMYLGPQIGTVCNLNTSVISGNPYFFGAVTNQLELNKWYLMVGYVFPAGSTDRTNAGAGVFDLETGLMLASGINFCWKAGQAFSGHRAYFFYSTDTTVRQYFCAPEVTLVTAPSTEIPKLNPLSATKTELAAQIQRIDQVTTDIAGKASASSVTSLTSEVGNVKVTATNALQTSVDTAGKIAATAGLMLDVNGHISGTKMYNDGTSAAFDIVADVFRVSTPTSIGRGETVFSVGNVNGVNKVGIRGDMLIDGSVTAKSLSVTNLQAVTTNTGSLNVTGDLKMTGGAILGGACWGWDWKGGSGNMSQNMYLGPNGLLLGSYNAGRYLQYSALDGSLTLRGGDITAGVLRSANWPTEQYIDLNAPWQGHFLQCGAGGSARAIIRTDGYAHFENIYARGNIHATSVTANTITADHIVARGITNAYSSSNGELWIEVPAGALVVIFISGSTTISGASGGSTVMATSCSASFQGQLRQGINFIAGVDFPVGTYPVSCRAGSTRTEAVAMVFRR
ncbi:phage tail protein [Deefgea piscis]|uniref:phage tail protein n=1 Tax=Deefgea piscis TaxID=2739061 RepID=UPI001C7EFEAC|nr:fibronectin type III domain-containing protein [Deefgea piscis]QZA80868.1 hypothetical protein K4H25_15460 [Deefgea piscis]